MSHATLDVTEETFNTEVIQSGGLVLVDFWGANCPPCRMLAPVLEDIATELAGKVKIAKIDAYDYPDLTAENGVTGLPTLVLFKGGKEIDRHVGFQVKSQLKSWLESHL